MKYAFILLGLFFCIQTSSAQQTPVQLGVELKTVYGEETEIQIIPHFHKISSTKDVLFIVNTQIVTNEFVNEVLKPHHVDKVEINRTTKAKNKYGNAAKNGVIFITIKNNHITEVNTLIASNNL